MFVFAGDVATRIWLLPAKFHAMYLVPLLSMATAGAVVDTACQPLPATCI